MIAAVFDGPRAIRLQQRDIPVPGPGEVLVRVAAAGLCAGDLYIFQGRNPYVTYPRVGGHEIAGVVERPGPGAEAPPQGTRVVVEPFIGCGRCYPCRIGKYNCCLRLSIVGVHRDGGFAGHLVAPADRLHRIPDGLSDVAASFAEPVAIGVQALRRAAVTAADRLLILGAGPIGLAVLEAARARGCEIAVTDVNAARLDVAARLGAETVDVAELDRFAGDEGVPVVIEATGVPAVMQQALRLVAAGGRAVILGLAPAAASVALPALDITRREMTVLGSRASADCMPEALALLASGAIRLPQIATALPLEEAAATFARLDADHAALHKAVFTVAEA